MNTYVAGKDTGGEEPDSREWVFGLLSNPRYRERLERLEKLDLRRRTGCEPCLRALVLDEWTPETLHHLGWCDSCRAATIALGMHAPRAAAAWYRRRAVWLGVAAAAVIAAPLLGSQLLDDHASKVGVRGGGAVEIRPHVVPKPRDKPPGVTPQVGHERTASTTARGHKALPLTT